MIVDDELFFARRLGFGLKQGEKIEGSIRDWAVAQISSIPKLDFYGPDGKSIRDQFSELADPVPDYKDATALVGMYFNKEHELLLKQAEMSPAEWDKETAELDRNRAHYPEWREALLRSLASVNGPSPVFERFHAFWVNHFTVRTEHLSMLWYGPHIRLIRKHMKGSFAEMLQDAILQPAMLFYLDNFLSSGPNSPAGKGGETINENLARELFELHTMSPAGGYTQEDIVEASYALSGWGFYAKKFDEPKRKNTPTGVFYDIERHEPGTRTILGKNYGKKNKGKDQASQLVADLAVHPATAEFISWKLVRHFVADVPPADSVARVKDAWIQSKGDLKTIHIAVIDEVMAKARDHEKFSSPTNWLHQLHRTGGIKVPLTEPHVNRDYWISLLCDELGEGFGTSAQPNGFSDVKSDWVSKELLERRVRYAYIATGTATKEGVAYLADFAVRLTGADSEVVANMRATDTPREAATVLLASPQFMRI